MSIAGALRMGDLLPKSETQSEPGITISFPKTLGWSAVVISAGTLFSIVAGALSYKATVDNQMNNLSAQIEALRLRQNEQEGNTRTTLTTLNAMSRDVAVMQRDLQNLVERLRDTGVFSVPSDYP